MNKSSILPKTGVDLANVIHRFGPKYTTQYAKRMMPSQRRALADIAVCCTEALGGRLYRCDDCQESFWQYHACRNRSCPKCQGKRTEAWLKQREAELLPCDYFHAVTTVPSELRDAFRRDQKVHVRSLDACLGRGGQGTLRQQASPGRLARYPLRSAYLERSVGLSPTRPHAHHRRRHLVRRRHWEPARNEYLLPVAVLSKKVAAKFRDAVCKQRPEVFKAYRRTRGNVSGFPSLSTTATATGRAQLPLALCTPRGHHQCTDPGSQPDARYLPLEGPRNRHLRATRLEGVEFLRRFLQHVLPQGFHKVRYYGSGTTQGATSLAGLAALVLEQPPATKRPMKIAELIEAVGQLTLFAESGNSDPDSKSSTGPVVLIAAVGKRRFWRNGPRPAPFGSPVLPSRTFADRIFSRTSGRGLSSAAHSPKKTSPLTLPSSNHSPSHDLPSNPTRTLTLHATQHFVKRLFSSASR